MSCMHKRPWRRAYPRGAACCTRSTHTAPRATACRLLLLQPARIATSARAATPARAPALPRAAGGTPNKLPGWPAAALCERRRRRWMRVRAAGAACVLRASSKSSSSLEAGAAACANGGGTHAETSHARRHACDRAGVAVWVAGRHRGEVNGSGRRAGAAWWFEKWRVQSGGNGRPTDTQVVTQHHNVNAASGAAKHRRRRADIIDTTAANRSRGLAHRHGGRHTRSNEKTARFEGRAISTGALPRGKCAATATPGYKVPAGAIIAVARRRAAIIPQMAHGAQPAACVHCLSNARAAAACCARHRHRYHHSTQLPPSPCLQHCSELPRS